MDILFNFLTGKLKFSCVSLGVELRTLFIFSLILLWLKLQTENILFFFYCEVSLELNFLVKCELRGVGSWVWYCNWIFFLLTVKRFFIVESWLLELSLGIFLAFFLFESFVTRIVSIYYNLILHVEQRANLL